MTEIFRSFQGEGHFVGYPMTFVRLAGCSVLKCHIRKECDEAPWKAKDHLTEDEILVRISGMTQTPGIVCITGGEPADHDLIPLVDRLNSTGYRVHLETSGTKSVAGLPVEWMTVSPKVPGYRQKTGHTLKLVVEPDWGSGVAAWDAIDEYDRGTNFLHRYLQPLTRADDPMAASALAGVVKILSHPGRNIGARWALSTQAHKYWGLH